MTQILEFRIKTNAYNRQQADEQFNELFRKIQEVGYISDVLKVTFEEEN